MTHTSHETSPLALSAGDPPRPPQEAKAKVLAETFLNLTKSAPNLAAELRMLRNSGALTTILPEFANTWGPRGEQSPNWHPEGNVWTHTLMVVEALPSNASYALRLAAIFHDIAKPATFFKYPTSGGITFDGHAQVGADMLRRIIGPRLGVDGDTLERAATLIEYHMFMHDFYKPEQVNADFQQHILKLPCVEELIELQHADVNGTGISPERKIEASYRERLRALLATNSQTV